MILTHAIMQVKLEAVILSGIIHGRTDAKCYHFPKAAAALGLLQTERRILAAKARRGEKSAVSLFLVTF